MVPTHIAQLFVALAEIGGTPAKISAGNERKLPPPATLFIAPAAKARPQGWRFARESIDYGRALGRGAFALGDAIDAAYFRSAPSLVRILCK